MELPYTVLHKGISLLFIPPMTTCQAKEGLAAFNKFFQNHDFFEGKIRIDQEHEMQAEH